MIAPGSFNQFPSTDPVEIYRYRDGIYAVDLLITGLVSLNFFTWLSRQPSNAEEICTAHGLAERPADVMLTLFTAMGAIENRAGKFHCTPLALEHLVEGSPWFLGPYYASLKERPVCKDLLQVLKTGRPANWGSVSALKEWSKAMETEEFARQFTAAMDCRGIYLGQSLASRFDASRFRKMLDIAGGSGIYACAFVDRYQQLRATVFEKPPVDAVARTMISSRGYGDRVQVEAGDMFADPLPRDHDLHLYSNVLHDWDFDKVRPLLNASFKALQPGGTLLIHDAFLNREKTAPLPVAEYSVILMHSTEGKCYSVGEIETLLLEAGFVNVRFGLNAADRGWMAAEKPA
jgi:predicted O-methyltransferase YrrM